MDKISNQNYNNGSCACFKKWGEGNPVFEGFLTIVVFGATGNLASQKIFPSLYNIYCNGFMPKKYAIVGFGRSNLSKEEFYKIVKTKIKAMESTLEPFLERCYYFSGSYDNTEQFMEFNRVLVDLESKYTDGGKVNRLFYYALPPNIYVTVSKSIKGSLMGNNGWQHIIVEKPFGKDYESSLQLGKDLDQIYTEDQIYRIDHYLGKEMVQNILIARFANLMFEPIWNARYIQYVQVIFNEDIGIEGRGGYFDEYGIIRDVIQNHLIQMISLIGMEFPVTLHSEDIRNEKVKLLKAVEPIKFENVILGQYSASNGKISYLQEKGVNPNSKTSTFCSLILYIKNMRWEGVPFLITSGKALSERKAEIKVCFKKFPGSPFGDVPNNELVIRVQPNEAMFLRTNIKQPGLETYTVSTELDLTIKNKFENVKLPEAYERLLIDSMRSEHSHFVRFDELQESWKIFTPLLHSIDKGEIPIYPYNWGTIGPTQYKRLIEKVKRNQTE